jgi:hypothetical protein
MGLFPYDDHRVRDIEQRSPSELAAIARDTGKARRARDHALWNLIYHRQPNLDGLLLDLARTDPDGDIRKSASWGLLKLDNSAALSECLSPDDDPNLRAWKLHLIHEARGSTEPFDERSVRKAEFSEPGAVAAFDMTMPLSVEGVVQFMDETGEWHLMTVSRSEREDIVGGMTAAVRAETFMTELVIQKRIENLFGSGTDYVDGYLFSGISRRSGINSVSHYYESTWMHSFYPAGRTGDDSQGVLEVGTRLYRIAETDLVTRDDLPFAYPQSVRGIFHGPVYMNPAVISDPDQPIQGMMQIVSSQSQGGRILANGWFYGSFRGVPEDVDGDGAVELDGIEMLVSPGGEVLEQRPATRAPAS